MVLLHLLLLCVVSALSAEDAAGAASTTLGPKNVRSGDLPEDYHMATASSEMLGHATQETNHSPNDAPPSTTQASEGRLAPTQLPVADIVTQESTEGHSGSETYQSPVLTEAPKTDPVSRSSTATPKSDILVIEEVQTIPSGAITEKTDVVLSTESPVVGSANSSTEVKVVESDYSQSVKNGSALVFSKNLVSGEDEKPSSAPAVAAARSFTLDGSDPEFSEDGVEVLEKPAKPSKSKKKIFSSRPKTSTEKLVFDKSDSSELNEANPVKSDTDLSKSLLSSTEDSTNPSKAEDRSFYTFSTSTTEVSTGRHTTSSLLITGIEKLVNNNLLNVIDTSVRPAEEDTTEALLKRIPPKTAIRFDPDEYGPTGQTDWVPLVSDKPSAPDWSPFVPAVTTERQRRKPSATTLAWKRPSSTTYRFPEPEVTPEPSGGFRGIKENIVTTTGGPKFTTQRPLGSTQLIEAPHVAAEGHEASGDTSELDLATWALATSKLTRKPFNATEAEIIEHVSFVAPPNNTVYKTLKENIQSAFSRATERYKLENVTKEHNQVLRNTIPDTVPVETTPPIPKWRPVVTVPPPPTTTEDKTKELTTQKQQEETTTPEDFTDVERNLAYEFLKITTVVPPKHSSGITEEERDSSTETNRVPMTSEKIVVTTTETSTTERQQKHQVILASQEAPIEETSLTTTELGFMLEDTEAETKDYDEINTTVAIPAKDVVEKLVENSSTTTVAPTTSTTTRTTTTTTTEIPVEVTTIAQELTTEGEAATSPPSTNKPDKSDDENRTIWSNDTAVADRPLTEDITEENVPAYLRLTVVTSEIELCHLLPELRASILKILSEGTNSNVSSDSLVLLNLNPSICRPVLSEERPDDAQVRHRPVNMFLMDETGDFNKNLSETFLRLWGEAGLDFPLPILKVDFVTPIPEGDMEPGLSGGVVAAIVISCVAGLCLILLGVLFVIMKRRQKKFNYGQRCTPVSLDAYSLDSVSIRNSSRRKGMRASKRSYGNPAFDDPEVPSHPVNFAGLANFSMEKEQLHEEFAVIPQVAPRADELPPGVESRNRYANVFPLPETRVTLKPREGDPLSDYINANFVKGLHSAENVYIAAQAPLESTLADWWRMIWEQQVKVVLMLTKLQENGVEKCADYLPPNEVTDNLRLFGDFQVTLKKRDVKDKYIVSTVQVKNMESSLWREVTHLWYVGWPHSGVPLESNSLIAFLIEARSQMKTSGGAPAPTLVHCSPGTGRTGTVIACDLLIREFEQKRLVDIPRCVYHLRRARAGAVQTRDQYAFIYQVLNTYATKLTGGALETI